jgi:hypothetical protein
MRFYFSMFVRRIPGQIYERQSKEIGIMRFVRLTGLVLLAVVTVGVVGAVSAQADPPNPLFRPANGQLVLLLSGTTILRFGINTILCKKDLWHGFVDNSLLIGDAFAHFLECQYLVGEEASGCEANSVGSTGGLILLGFFHGILGLILPSRRTGILFLPQGSTKFTTLAEATKEGKTCAPESAVTGSFAGVVEPAGVSQKATTIKVQLIEGVASIKDIDLTHGLGLVVPKLVGFAQTGALEGIESGEFSEATEVT